MTRRVGLRFVLESNPKLTALAEVLAEVDPLIAAPGGAPSAKPGCSVLVAARDDRTAYHLRNVFSQGVDASCSTMICPRRWKSVLARACNVLCSDSYQQAGMSRFLSKHVARSKRTPR